MAVITKMVCFHFSDLICIAWIFIFITSKRENKKK